MFSDLDQKNAQELVEIIHFFNQKDWSPATSTNYSVRSENPDFITISRSGVDKSKFSIKDLIQINLQGEITPCFSGQGIASSAETEIHTALYQRYPEIKCVLHTHSVLGTVLSLAFVKEKAISFEGWEILKGLSGNPTHELTEVLPIVPNSQNMSDILKLMDPYFKSKLDIHGFLIAGHGLYTWGKDIATAKRHIETFEFLFECFYKMRGL